VGNVATKVRYPTAREFIIITDKPQAMAGRLPEFDNSRKIRKPHRSEPLKAHLKEAFNERQEKVKSHNM